MRASRYSAVLFDFDGTLADTAPDLAAALNTLRLEDGLDIVPSERLRPHTSNGVRGLLASGYGITPDSPNYAELSQRFLNRYAECLHAATALFPGMDELLRALERQDIPWGVVTNKASRFTHPIITHLGLAERTACVVCGDSTLNPKPAPDPLLLAGRLLAIDPARCMYVGDDHRDILSARRAGMASVAALWGYLGTGLPPQAWNADFQVSHPRDIATFV